MARTFWNGEPCSAVVVRVIVADDARFPNYWARDLIGTEREAVRVTYHGQTVYLDNPPCSEPGCEVGTAWHKVTDGFGSPQYGHSSLAVEHEVPAAGSQETGS